MENQNPPERTLPVQYARSRAFRQFKNPPQPHMCIEDSIKDTSEKLYINVLGWQKIANPKQYTDPIPLYGGMQVPQACGPNSSRPPMLVFAVMVNPDILKANGKNAANPTDREALVSLLCEFVEAMNPGLALTRRARVLPDRDLAGELKDVWLCVQDKRARDRPAHALYKVYDIDGIGGEEPDTEHVTTHDIPQTPVKSSKQILLNAGQKSEFDSGMNNCQLNTQKESLSDTTYCAPLYGQIVSTRENHNQIGEIQQKFASSDTKPSSSFRKEANNATKSEGWDEFAKRNLPTKNEENKKQRCFKTEKTKRQVNGNHYDFFPFFDNKGESGESGAADNDDSANIIMEPMQKLVLQDNKLCDTKCPLSSVGT